MKWFQIGFRSFIVFMGVLSFVQPCRADLSRPRDSLLTARDALVDEMFHKAMMCVVIEFQKTKLDTDYYTTFSNNFDTIGAICALDQLLQDQPGYAAEIGAIVDAILDGNDLLSIDKQRILKEKVDAQLEAWDTYLKNNC